MEQKGSYIFRIILFILFILFVLPITTSSTAAEQDTYVALKAGIYSPQEDPFKDFDTGINGEIALGTYLTPNYVLELGVGYFESEGSGVIVAPGNVIIPADGELSVIPVTLNLKYLYPMGRFDPYAEAGAGVYVADADVSGGGIDLSDRYTNIGAFLGVGFNIDISRTLFLGMEGRYHWVREHEFTLGQVTQNAEIDGFTATVNLGYRYGIGLRNE